jgi:hypothetical protein
VYLELYEGSRAKKQKTNNMPDLKMSDLQHPILLDLALWFIFDTELFAGDTVFSS